jgi:riboflavin biosynthesis pyrimidine reductase
MRGVLSHRPDRRVIDDRQPLTPRPATQVRCGVAGFSEFAAGKSREAEQAHVAPFSTVEDRSAAFDVVTLGNDWSRHLYDGPFHITADRGGDVPLISLVFVQSHDGNTGAANPDSLGGGPVDKHVIYEGLSRVAADGVLAGSKSVGKQSFFSVWHPQLVSLRAALGLPRHPAQVIVTGRACVDFADTLLFNVPDAPVYIISTPAGCERLKAGVKHRPHVELVRMTGDDLRAPLSFLRRERGVRRISAIGGRTTASALIDQRLVQDVYLTTAARNGGEPNTPFYTGTQPLDLNTVVRKEGGDREFPIVFVHSMIVPGRNLSPAPLV